MQVHQVSLAWIMKPLMIRWNGAPLKCSGSPMDLPVPASPVHSCLKFSAVCAGTACHTFGALQPLHATTLALANDK